jgi:NAD(P)-dependent dehydrogenase (short-subunit alcohol dehydrogenase family)
MAVAIVTGSDSGIGRASAVAVTGESFVIDGGLLLMAAVQNQ